MPNSFCPWLARGGHTTVAPRRATVTIKGKTEKVNRKNKRSRPIVRGHGIVVGVDGARFGVHVGDRHVVIDISVGRVGLGCIFQSACRNGCGAGLNRAFGGSGALHGCKRVKLGDERWKMKEGGEHMRAILLQVGEAQHWQVPLTSAKDACAGVEGVVSPELDTDPDPDALHCRRGR